MQHYSFLENGVAIATMESKENQNRIYTRRA